MVSVALCAIGCSGVPASIQAPRKAPSTTAAEAHALSPEFRCAPARSSSAQRTSSDSAHANAPVWVRTRDAQCSFAGRLVGDVPLYADDASALVLATLRTADVEFSLLAEYGARLPATVSFPIAASGYVENPSLWLTERHEVVPGHVWVPAGTAVETYSASEAGVRVKVPLGAPDALPHWPSEFGGSVPCESLSVERPIAATRPAPASATRPSLELEDGKVILHDKPFGTPIGFFTADEHAASLISERDGWYRVVLSRPFHADAWIERTALGEDPWPEHLAEGLPEALGPHPPTQDPRMADVPDPDASVASVRRPRSHGDIATQPLDLRLRPDRNAAIVARIAHGAAISRVGDHKAFVEVAVSGVVPAEGAHFYVSRRQYASRVAPAEESPRKRDRDGP